MSVASSVFLKQSAMPTPARWAAAIREAGLEYSFQKADASLSASVERALAQINRSR